MRKLSFSLTLSASNRARRNVLYGRCDDEGVARLPNALDPDRMSPAERLAEIGEILAAGLIRLRTRQREAEARRSGESFFDFPADQSVHG